MMPPAGGDPPAARLARAAGQVAAVRADAFSHPGHAAPGGAGDADAAGAIVLDFDPDLARCEPQPDGRARARPGVLHRVGQGFLDEAEDDQLDAWRRVPWRAAALVPDRQPGRPDPGEQAVKVGQARERLP
jgi:hypothetical protein